MPAPIKIFSAEQIRAADTFTIENEPIASIDLMERAAHKCVDWLMKHFKRNTRFKIFCGLGNNGGDGLAITRLLHLFDCDVTVYILRHSEKYAPDFSVNLKRLEAFPEIKIIDLNESNLIESFPFLSANDVIIDAIFGTGLSKEISGLVAECIQKINLNCASIPKFEIISIDLPSGLFADVRTNPNSPIVNATTTLSFQFPKLSFMFAENAPFVGNFEILDIGLNNKFIEKTPTDHYYLTKNFIKSLIQPRKKFSNKGTFGHALIVAGSYGKIGAALLAGNACLRSGVGLLTMYIPKCGYEIIQNGIPEAMTLTDSDDKIFSDEIVPVQNFSAIGIGPGIGTDIRTQNAFLNFLKKNVKPLVIDADALNILSLNEAVLQFLPTQSILTPHLKEFERLTRKVENDFERHALQINYSITHKLFVVLKGANTCITTPEGKSYFNSTGNPGMAKGGSGDILTGILTGLLAQGYTNLETCLLGAFVHGLAGDLAKKNKGEIGMISGDIIESLPEAFLFLLD